MFSFLETDVSQLWGPYCSVCINTKFINHVKEKDQKRLLMIFEHNGDKAELKTLPELMSQNGGQNPFPPSESGHIRCVSCSSRTIDSCSDTTAAEDLNSSPSQSAQASPQPSVESFSADKTDQQSPKSVYRIRSLANYMELRSARADDDCLDTDGESAETTTPQPMTCILDNNCQNSNSNLDNDLEKDCAQIIAIPVIQQTHFEAEDVFEQAVGVYLPFFKFEILHEEIMISRFKMSKNSYTELASKNPLKYFQAHRHFIGILSSSDRDRPKEEWSVLQAFDCANFQSLSPLVSQDMMLLTTLFVVPNEIYEEYEHDSTSVKYRLLGTISSLRPENSAGRQLSLKSQMFGLRILLMSVSQERRDKVWHDRNHVCPINEKWKQCAVLASSPHAIYCKLESAINTCFSSNSTQEDSPCLLDVLFRLCVNFNEADITSKLDKISPSYDNAINVLNQAVNEQFSSAGLKWIFDLEEDKLEAMKFEPCQKSVVEISLPNRWRYGALRGKKKDQFELKVLLNDDFNISLLREEPILCVVPDIDTTCRPVAISHLDHILKVQRARLHHDIPILNVVLIRVSLDRYMEYADGERLQTYPIYEDSLSTGLIFHMRYVIEKRETVWANRKTVSFNMMPISITLLLSIVPDECFTMMVAIIGRWKCEHYFGRYRLFSLLANVAWTNDEKDFLKALRMIERSPEEALKVLSDSLKYKEDRWKVPL